VVGAYNGGIYGTTATLGPPVRRDSRHSGFRRPPASAAMRRTGCGVSSQDGPDGPALNPAAIGVRRLSERPAGAPVAVSASIRARGTVCVRFSVERVHVEPRTRLTLRWPGLALVRPGGAGEPLVAGQGVFHLTVLGARDIRQ
jgi:hypothetical protein